MCVVKPITGVALAAALMFLPATSHGAGFIYNLGEVFSGTPPSSASIPWVTALFEDVAPGQVRLTIQATSLVGSENVDSLFFNLNPAHDAALLNFNLVSSSGGFNVPTGSGIHLGLDEFKADGDGKYDIKFVFATGPKDVNRFNGRESFVVDITGIPSLNVFDFTYLSAPEGGAGPFYAAGHVQRITGADPGSNSGWISPIGGTYQLIPEPAAGGFLLAGLIAFALRLRRA